MRPVEQPLLSEPAACIIADRFIPVRASDLACALVEDAPQLGIDAGEFKPVLGAIHEIIAAETMSLERWMSDLYAAFNPDRDTLPFRPLESLRTPEAYADFERRLTYLFDKANFERLTEMQISTAIQEANTHGLRIRVRPEMVEQLVLWVRGRGTVRRKIWCWRRPRNGQMRDFAVYRQLAVMARLKGDPAVYLKLFRDIPVADVEALLPHAEVRMSWIDRLKVVGGGAGAFGGVLIKLVQGAMTLAYLSQLMWVALVACAIMALRTFFGFRRTKAVRDGQRNKHLYYQNVANNAGVLSWLIDMIGQEEEKEALLGYGMCARGCAGVEDLRRRAGGYLHRRFGAVSRFDALDAAETMERLGLWADREQMQVVPPAEAAARLSGGQVRMDARTYHEKVVYLVRPASEV